MTKTELVESVAQDLGLSKAEAQRTLETVLERITTGLIRDQKCQTSLPDLRPNPGRRRGEDR